MTAAADLAVPGVEAAPGGDVCVLHGRQLRVGALLMHTSRFSDPIWHLMPAMLQNHQVALGLNFGALPDQHQGTARRLCYAMLSGTLPAAEVRLSVSTVKFTFDGLKHFFTWLDTRAGADMATAADVTSRDLLDFQRHLLVSGVPASVRYAVRCSVRMMWRYRCALPGESMTFDPQHVRGWAELRGSRPENATERIPEPVLGPLVSWAARFVDEFSTDILAADRRRTQMRRAVGDPVTPPGGVDELLTAALAGYRRREVPLPGRGGTLNEAFLAQQMGVCRGSLVRHRPALQAAARELGVADDSVYDVPITATVDARPWVDGLISDPNALCGLTRVSRQLHIACYILIAYLSGMRDGEIKALRRGCLQVQRDVTGAPYRWSVTGRAFKGEHDPTGVVATWVIGAPAARAITVLEQLQPAEVDLLFTRIPGSGADSGTRPADSAALTGSATNRQLNDFITWVNDFCAERRFAEQIPTVEDVPWRLTTRQFRRTLAWFIARRPGGAIAGAIAYRHQAIQMFEGYAGTSDSGFRAEVESEQALARGEHLMAMIDRHEHTSLAGPAGIQAAARLHDFGTAAGFAGVTVTDPHRLKRLMARDDPAIYPGDYVHCVFDPAKALCLRNSHAASHPELQHCQPLDCTNVALGAANTTTWLGEIQTIDQRLRDRPPLPPLLAARLTERRTGIARFLQRHTGPATDTETETERET